MKHLKRHSDRTGYYPLEASELDIAGEMLQGQAQHLDGVRTLLGRVRRDHRGMDLCLSEASAYLPEDFSFTGKVFFTFGYDIGVAMDRNASLNLAHPRFRKDPDEVWYYCIHEVHHTGVMHYHPMPRLGDVTTTSQLVELVRYLTFLEGTAVYAAHDARRRGQFLASPLLWPWFLVGHAHQL